MMANKYTYKNVKEYIESYNYTLLSKEYKNTKEKLKIKCDNGHEYLTAFRVFKKGHRCRFCQSINQSLDIEIVRKDFERHGFTLLSKNYNRAKEKLDVICDQNHKFQLSHDQLKRKSKKSKCPTCREIDKLSPIRKICDTIGYKLLEYYRDKEKKQTVLKLLCSNNHLCEPTYSDFKRGTRCLICLHDSLRHDFTFIENEYKKEGYILLSKYKGSFMPLKVKCPEGHLWNSYYSNFQRGIRCPHCSNRAKKSIDFIKKEYQKEGYIFLDDYYNNNSYLHNIVCNRGHHIKFTYSSFQQGRRCLFCCKHAPVTTDIVKKELAKEGYTFLSPAFKNSRSSILLRCNNNHEYRTRWNTFQQGKRCKECAKYGFKHDKPAFLYYAKIIIENISFYKIGITNNHPQDRLNHIHDSAELLWYKHYLFGKFAYQDEQKIIKQYSDYLASDPSLEIRSGYTEIFTKDILNLDK